MSIPSASIYPAASLEREPLLARGLLEDRLAEHGNELALLKEAVAEIDATGVRQFDAGVPAHVLVRKRADALDRVLRAAWRAALDGFSQRAALVAVGGYGRAELHPASDVDILILCPEGACDASAGMESIGRFVTWLWDMGLDLGQSVRSVAECVEAARSDITIATNLMEARLIDGDHALYESMRRATGPDAIWASRDFFEAKRREQAARHQRYHDTAYNLEPNVKGGPGGLRDIQMIGWVVKRHFGAETLEDLLTQGFLTAGEYETLIEGQNFLWQVRMALHVTAGRREDRLLFEHQREIAARFGFEDDEHNLGVERFMRRYYLTIMELSRLNEMLLELFQELFLEPGGEPEIVPLNRRFQTRNGYLEVTSDHVFKRYPFALLEMFLLLQQSPHIKGVRASTIRLVRDHRYLIDDSYRNDLGCRSLFLEIIRQPRGITHELRRMHTYGVLGDYLPAFGRIIGLMQFDLFHAYTVDEHILFTVRNLRQFAVPEHYHELPRCSDIMPRLRKPELLYLAALFHDIAKGRGGDHSELGAEDALDFCLQHDLDKSDARLVSWLVRQHLLMSVTAQRRDIYDPDVIASSPPRCGTNCTWTTSTA
jgi:[protein-PII] uridylyltransferase